MTTDADRSSFFIALVVVDIFVGLADAITGPYIVLFLVDEARFSPLSLSAILTARALSGIVFSTAFGAWIDRRTSVAPLLLALGGSAVGYALLGLTTDFVALLVIAAIPVAIGAAAFSQSIALAKRNFSQANPHTVNRAIGVLRASWSLAWAIGPAIGAILIDAAGYRGAFFASAASGAIALATLAVVRSRVVLADAGHARPPKPANGGPAIALAFAALALFHTAESAARRTNCLAPCKLHASRMQPHACGRRRYPLAAPSRCLFAPAGHDPTRSAGRCRALFRRRFRPSLDQRRMVRR